MFRPSNRTLIRLAAVAVLVVATLVPSLLLPTQAGAAGAGAPAATACDTTTEIAASSVSETRQGVSDVLAANDASRAWPAVDSDLTPKLDKAVAVGAGPVESDVAFLSIKVHIKCTISFPPLHIKCTITVTIKIGF